MSSAHTEIKKTTPILPILLFAVLRRLEQSYYYERFFGEFVLFYFILFSSFSQIVNVREPPEVHAHGGI